MAAATARTSLGFFPFTSEQWKELETQAMIYKYMMSSLPVPPDLLFPTITRYLSHHHHPSPVSSSNSTLVRGYLRFPKGKDQEPWRCKRTDGKKWRCAKYVAQDQKYCERHMHRGRPRSRKPVEQQQLHHHHSDFININNNNSKKGRFQSNVVVLPPNPMLSNSREVSGNVGRNLGSSTTTIAQAQPYIGNPIFLDRSDKKACDFESLVSVSSSYKEPRKMDWMMKGEAVTMASTSATHQQWHQHLMQTKTGLMATNQNSYSNSNNTSIFNQHYEVEPLNFVDSEGPNNETPRSFIDAWSNEEMNDKNGNFSNNDSVSVSSNGKLSLSSLNLFMGSKNTINDEMGHLQMGLGLIESDHHQSYGGPLGEVLRPAAAGSSASNPEFLMGGNVDSDSPQATTVSSPSGVLQKTLASFSDSSNCSSPTTTLVASRVKPEIAFQWLN